MTAQTDKSVDEEVNLILLRRLKNALKALTPTEIENAKREEELRKKNAGKGNKGRTG
jgi:hypothetical protein